MLHQKITYYLENHTRLLLPKKENTYLKHNNKTNISIIVKLILIFKFKCFLDISKIIIFKKYLNVHNILDKYIINVKYIILTVQKRYRIKNFSMDNGYIY